MPNRLRDYHRPEDIATAVELLARTDVRAAPLVIGPRPPSDPFKGVEAVVDLSHLNLDYIKEENGVVRIGAMTPLQDLVDSPLIKSLADGILAEAALLSAHLGLRNLATLQGALRPDSPPEVQMALLALESMPVMNGDVLVEVRLGRQPGARGALERLARAPRDVAIVAACAVVEVEGGVCRRARVAVASPEPRRLESVEKLLAGQTLTPDRLQLAAEAAMAEAKVESDYRASAEYRRKMAGVLTRRALAKAWERVHP
ncbi:MAG: FAD binding domain-containing protein [Chloroflexota bacterium]